MDRKKIILWAALIGAAIGFKYASIDFHLSSVPFLAPDRELLNHRGFLVVCVAMWAVFGLYWEQAAKKASAAKSAESKGSRAIHVFLANAALVLEIAPVHGIGRLVPISPVVMAGGLAVEALGVFIAIWARRHLGRHWSGEITVKVDHQLIRSGPYRLLRHPIYTGLLTMYLGAFLVTGEWLAAIGLAMAMLGYWRKIRLEEETLEAAFGAQYDAYRRDSWALVPGIY